MLEVSPQESGGCACAFWLACAVQALRAEVGCRRDYHDQSAESRPLRIGATTRRSPYAWLCRGTTVEKSFSHDEAATTVTAEVSRDWVLRLPSVIVDNYDDDQFFTLFSDIVMCDILPADRNVNVQCELAIDPTQHKYWMAWPPLFTYAPHWVKIPTKERPPRAIAGGNTAHDLCKVETLRPTDATNAILPSYCRKNIGGYLGFCAGFEARCPDLTSAAWRAALRMA
ncbi:hypothetical protein POSPLADRAFT_1031009 [Postia placenta MAD-698-R-SB12]|uniref:Uncharacterized protein n=1 Tax=Postia placenta MAD-698-R-SB12 TaxID=670580 RepID=A0A1X6NAP6_9APHY|nr:hypothetical protein POSPLADRAFT_1031009 [Postia placenta MAD-698-R-SB12]OSX65719.1 hypothetical protein POSPLADRAFT_1031009 [Postia placenta MAD-698-R-SB12]